jgi:hypothetical protein
MKHLSLTVITNGFHDWYPTEERTEEKEEDG